MLEQRTGRVNRIGGKVGRMKQSIHVYTPFIAATRDEKQYRVVMDREFCFSVLMRDDFKLDFASTKTRADRMPLPEFASTHLRFNLNVS